MAGSEALTPRISFAIPYYRGRGYLQEAIESVRAQTVDEWELIVVDDCGPEPADDLVALYRDPRIRYVRNRRNLGLSGNWNECLRLTRAPMVNILHGDDRLRPEYAASVLAAADAHPGCAAVFTDSAYIDSEGRATTTLIDSAKRFARRRAGDHTLTGDADTAVLMAGNYIQAPAFCLRRDLVGPAPFHERWRFVPDWDLALRLLLDDQSLRCVREPLLEYRRHSSSQTSVLTLDSSRFSEEFEFLQEMTEAARAKGWARSARSARRRISVRGYLLVQVLGDLLHGRLRGAIDKWRVLVRDVTGHMRRRP